MQQVLCLFFPRLLGSDKASMGLIGGSDLNLDIRVQGVANSSFT